MPDIGAPELLIILAIVVLLFGAGKLSGLGSALGRSIREFREERDGVKDKSKSQAERVSPLQSEETSDTKQVSTSESAEKREPLESGEVVLSERPQM